MCDIHLQRKFLPVLISCYLLNELNLQKKKNKRISVSFPQTKDCPGRDPIEAIVVSKN